MRFRNPTESERHVVQILSVGLALIQKKSSRDVLECSLRLENGV